MQKDHKQNKTQPEPGGYRCSVTLYNLGTNFPPPFTNPSLTK